jgi:hypothetical protein
MVETGGPAYYHRERQVPGVYRMGVGVGEIDGVTVYIHGGAWSTLTAYVPSLDVA